MKGTYTFLKYFKKSHSHVTNKIKRLCKGYEVINEQLMERRLLVDTRSATDLRQILSNSIDYIFTDPPYAGNIQYGELNFVWEAWLGFDTQWHDEEIIVNEIRGKTEADWANDMRRAMSECYRVLPGRAISLCYHDTSDGTWSLVQDIMAEAGFVVESPAPLFSLTPARNPTTSSLQTKSTNET